MCTTKPHLKGTRQSEEDPVKLVDASSLLLIQTCASERVKSSTNLEVHVKNLHLGPAGWLSQNQGFSHLPYDKAHAHCWHTLALTLQKLNQHSYEQYYSPSPPGSPSLQKGCEPRSHQPVSHPHLASLLTRTGLGF